MARTWHHLASITAALLALSPGPVAAQVTGTTDWAQPERSTPEPAADPVPTAPGRLPRPDGLLSVEALFGSDAGGGAGGVRVSFGVEGGAGWRFELGAGALLQSVSGDAGASRYQLARAFSEVGVARRFGRLEPWVAAGMTAISAERSGQGNSDSCILYSTICFTGGGGGGGDGVHGPSLAAGVRFAINDVLLAGASVRAMLLARGSLGDLPAEVSPTAPWFGLSLTWRPGGGR
jgi:hypothetical protein